MDAKGSKEDTALAEAEKEARELEEQQLLKPQVSAAMRRIFEDYSIRGSTPARWPRTRRPYAFH